MPRATHAGDPDLRHRVTRKIALIVRPSILSLFEPPPLRQHAEFQKLLKEVAKANGFCWADSGQRCERHDKSEVSPQVLDQLVVGREEFASFTLGQGDVQAIGNA